MDKTLSKFTAHGVMEEDANGDYYRVKDVRQVQKELAVHIVEFMESIEALFDVMSEEGLTKEELHVLMLGLRGFCTQLNIFIEDKE